MSAQTPILPQSAPPAPAGHWDEPDEDGSYPAITADEWSELMADVAQEQTRLETEATEQDAQREAERAAILADFESEQKAFYALCRYDELKLSFNSDPIVLQEKKSGLRVVANQPMLTAFFAEEHLILWEPETKSFFAYQQSGIWKKQADEWVSAQLMELLSRLSRESELPPIECAALCTETLTAKLVKLLRGQVLMEGVFDNRWPVVPVANAVLQIGDEPNQELVVTEHHPSYFNRYALPVSFEMEAQCPQFLAFLEWALPDGDDRRLLRAIAGQWLLGVNVTQIFLIMEGTGGSGKSTLLKILRELIGRENCGPLRSKHLNDRFEIGHLMDKTLLIASDVSDDFLSSTSAETLKGLTGGDLFGAEIKYGDMPSVEAQFNAVVATNNRLSVPLKGEGDLTAWRRRLVILKFLTPEAEHPEPGLAKRLFAEEGSGILNWALAGIADLRSGPGGRACLPLAEKHYAEVERFLGESNSLEAFVRECLLHEEGGSLSNDEIKRAYRAYCDKHGWPMVRGLDSRLKSTVETTWEVTQRRDKARGESGRWYPDLNLKGGLL